MANIHQAAAQSAAANTTVPLDEENARALFELIEALDDNDDVQTVYANEDVAESVLARIGAGADA